MSRKDDNQDIEILRRVVDIPWSLVFLVTVISCIGFITLYSASSGDIDRWASRQMARFVVGFFIMLFIAMVDIRIWFRASYIFYVIGLLFLLLVMFKGEEGGLGAQRWLNIGGFQFQPSEFMKVFLVLAMARYYQLLHPNNVQKFFSLFVPLVLIAISGFLVLKQPNLGTAAIMCMMGVIIIFLAGLSWKKFLLAGIICVALLPVAWNLMHDYQKQRVYTFLNPESDPLGSGYNIIQSKIAIGSGGLMGKGFLNGTQGQLSFVPEKHTDFIFSVIAEEFGFVGSIAVIFLYALLIFIGMAIAVRSVSTFGKLVASGISTIFFLHLFINTGMVNGILPVVGVPLPLLSYGGSSMLGTLMGVGFMLNVYVHRDIKIYSSD